MKYAAGLVCGLLAVRGFAQIEALQAHDTTKMQDTIRHTTVRSDGEDSVGTPAKSFTRSTKIAFEELHILDLSTLPVNVGEKEYRAPSLGRRWESAFAPVPRVKSGALAASFGNYTTPSLSGWWGSASRAREVLIRAFYASSNGSEEHRDYQKGNGSVAAAWVLPENAGLTSNKSLRAELGVDGSRYRLFGSTTPSQQRTRTSLTAQATFEAPSSREGVRHAMLQFGRIRMDDRTRVEETILAAQLEVGARAGTVALAGRLSIMQDFHDLPAASRENPLYTSAELSAHHRVNEQFELEGGAALYFLRYSSLQQSWHAFPRARILYRPVKDISFVVEYQPKVLRNSIGAFTRHNPYLDGSMTVRHTKVAADVRVGCLVQAGGNLRMQTAVRYQRLRGYPVYVERIERLWQIAYIDASRILSFEADAYLEAGSSRAGVTFDLKTTGRAAGENKEIPYVSNVCIAATIQHSFAHAVRVSSDVRYTGRRFADLDNNRRLAPFALWDAAVEVGERVLVGAGVTNILDRREGMWDGYREEPRRVHLSLGYTW